MVLNLPYPCPLTLLLHMGEGVFSYGPFPKFKYPRGAPGGFGGNWCPERLGTFPETAQHFWACFPENVPYCAYINHYNDDLTIIEHLLYAMILEQIYCYPISDVETDAQREVAWPLT